MKQQNNNRIGFQVKAFADGVVADSESRTISGYAAVFGNKDRDGDILLRGCFAKSIADRGPESQANGKIMFLWQHDHSQPLGRITKLQEDEKGLYFEAELDEVEEADRALKQLESGTLNQFSIGFSYVYDGGVRYDESVDACFISEVKLYEISVVSIAANPETEYLGLKSFEEKQAEEVLAAEVAAACKGLDITKQEQIQRAVTRAMFIASKSVPSVTHEQEAPTVAEVKGYFDFLQ